MRLTKKQRAEVVELLRCAADECSLTSAGVIPRDGTTDEIAWDAKRAVQIDSSVPRRYRYPYDEPDGDEQAAEERYRWMLLEAAQRVEEGTWP